MTSRAGDVCGRCGGTGWVVERRDEREIAVRCECARERAREASLRASRIPARYAHCTLDGFEIWGSEKNFLVSAKRKTQEFVDLYPRVEKGLLFMGETGCGKTHLAVAALRELVLDKGARGLYANAVELIIELQMSFDAGGGRSRDAIIMPIVEAEVLVLDELGGGKLSPWVMDILYYIINSRYMAKRLTLCTTNFSDFPKTAPVDRGSGQRQSMELPDGDDRLRLSETFADRITAPLRSRLYEMCDLVDIRSGDYRARNAPGRRGRS